MRCVGLGEALFDLLPGGRKLGGAPLNAALNADQLLGRHGDAVVASRVGRDPLGDEVAAALRQRRIPTDYLQRDSARPTGTVNVTLQNGQPQYEIAAGAAWDYFEFDDSWQALARHCDGVTYGTLAFRSPTSAAALTEFLQNSSQAVRLLDVNLRQQFFSGPICQVGLELATIVKLNDEELPILTGLCGVAATDGSHQVAALEERFDLDAVMVTHGATGLTLFAAGERHDVRGVHYQAAADADSVGAGDACAAAFLVGWVLRQDPATIANVANRLGAYVASQSGGTPILPADLADAYGDVPS